MKSPFQIIPKSEVGVLIVDNHDYLEYYIVCKEIWEYINSQLPAGLARKSSCKDNIPADILKAAKEWEEGGEFRKSRDEFEITFGSPHEDRLLWVTRHDNLVKECKDLNALTNFVQRKKLTIIGEMSTPAY